MKFFGIYKITNLTNGKMYIGKHHSEETRRKIAEARRLYLEGKMRETK